MHRIFQLRKHCSIKIFVRLCFLPLTGLPILHKTNGEEADKQPVIPPLFRQPFVQLMGKSSGSIVEENLARYGDEWKELN